MERLKRGKVCHIFVARVTLFAYLPRFAAYVALSRCTSLEGLEVHNFSPATVIAHPKYVDELVKLRNY